MFMGMNDEMFMELYVVYFQYITSIGSERLSSKAGIVLTKLISGLGKNSVYEILFVHHNQKSLKMYGK